MLQTDLNSFSYKKGTVVPWCKRCGSERLHKDGTDKESKQRFECKQCGFRSVWTSDFPHRRVFSQVIALATELYTTVGISLRTIAKKFKKYFGIKVSHECVRKWVLVAKNLLISDEEIIPTKTWHIDETYIKIKGRGFWLWIVYCRESRHVIAWHISDTRLLKDAVAVLQKAIQQTQGVRPTKIITDGLWQYPVAIYKVMGWNWREHKQHHMVDSGIGKNALIERLNREVKRRIKWFSTFQALEGANAFFNLFFYHLNNGRTSTRGLT